VEAGKERLGEIARFYNVSRRTTQCLNRGIFLAIIDLYAKRKRREAGNTPDIYTYDKLSEPLKVQIIHVWNEVIGVPSYNKYGKLNHYAQVYQEIVQSLRTEIGVFRLSDDTRDYREPEYAYPELCKYFLLTKPIDDDLSVVELTCRWIDIIVGEETIELREAATNAINEINIRFDEHGIGYQYSDRKIIRRDSAYIHQHAVMPTLIILRDKIYNSAQEEFISAHEHYKDGKMAECLVDACKSFESTMKIICEKRKWKYNSSMTASQLIQICLDNGLIPTYWQAHFSHLRGLLEASIPTARNKQAGHGAGVLPPHNPPRELVAYVLHMTASTILFLTEAERAIQ
jgi:hypothetical protein